MPTDEQSPQLSDDNLPQPKEGTTSVNQEQPASSSRSSPKAEEQPPVEPVEPSQPEKQYLPGIKLFLVLL